MVNSSTEKLRKTAKAVVGRFPFYGIDDDYEARARVARALARAIRNIDPVAWAVKNSFWPSFVDDVAIGDLATEAFEPPTPVPTENLKRDGAIRRAR